MSSANDDTTVAPAPAVDPPVPVAASATFASEPAAEQPVPGAVAAAFPEILNSLKQELALALALAGDAPTRRRQIHAVVGKIADRLPARIDRANAGGYDEASALFALGETLVGDQDEMINSLGGKVRHIRNMAMVQAHVDRAAASSDLGNSYDAMASLQRAREVELPEDDREDIRQELQQTWVLVMARIVVHGWECCTTTQDYSKANRLCSMGIEALKSENDDGIMEMESRKEQLGGLYQCRGRARLDLWKDDASAHSFLEQMEGALEDANEAIRLDPDDAYTHILKGKVSRALGNPREALASFEKALALGTTDSGAQWYVKMLKEMLEKKDKLFEVVCKDATSIAFEGCVRRGDRAVEEEGPHKKHAADEDAENEGPAPKKVKTGATFDGDVAGVENAENADVLKEKIAKLEEENANLRQMAGKTSTGESALSVVCKWQVDRNINLERENAMLKRRLWDSEQRAEDEARATARARRELLASLEEDGEEGGDGI